MKKIFKLLIFFPLFAYNGCDSVEPNSKDFYQIDFLITGGLMGLQHKTSVYEGGSAAFSQYIGGKEFIISAQLIEKQFEDLSSALNRNNIFKLADSYRLPQPIIDGFSYYIEYESSRGTKTILVDQGAEIQEELKDIIGIMTAIGSGSLIS